MVKNLAIIPARSGSKRVKDKNIMPFMGKPMLVWTIEAALKSGVFDDVIVSTDSEIYAEIAKKAGAWVPFLREENNDDYSTLAQVMLHVLDSLEKKLSKKYDNFASLQVSCPLRNEKIIKNVYEDFIKTNAKTTLTCFEFNFMNPWWAFKMDEKGNADFVLNSPAKSRSQDNSTLYCPTGAVGFARVEDFRQDSSFYGEGHKFFPIDWKYAVDIDNIEDVEMGKAVFLMLNKENK